MACVAKRRADVKAEARLSGMFLDHDEIAGIAVSPIAAAGDKGKPKKLVSGSMAPLKIGKMSGGGGAAGVPVSAGVK